MFSLFVPLVQFKIVRIIFGNSGALKKFRLSQQEKYNLKKKFNFFARQNNVDIKKA